LDTFGLVRTWEEERNRMAQKGQEEPMPTIEGKQAAVWIDGYVKKAGKLESVRRCGH